MSGRRGGGGGGGGGGKQAFYAVQSGRSSGVYSTWAECQAQVSGFSGAVYKKFDTAAEAAAFAASTSGYATPAAVHSAPAPSYHRAPAAAAPAPQHQRTSAWIEPAAHRTPPTATPRARMIDEVRTAPPAAPPGGPLHVYTDGSCLGNGQQDPRAGYGVWFGPGDPRNVAQRLPDRDQTNNRAELTAVIKALEITRGTPEVVIHSDSTYMKDGIEKWIHNWRTTGFRGGQIKNVDLWQRLDELMQERQGSVKLATVREVEWVKGHSGDGGNEGADDLANLGARMPLDSE
nr:hypothetical protein HK105_004514 [Polyrhizophydium stewartii]